MGDATQFVERRPRCQLLALPLELRLEICHNVVFTSLSANRPYDIRGFFLSCRQIHAELEDDFICKARPVLNAMNYLQSGTEEIKHSRLFLPDFINLNSELRILGIEIPFTSLPTGKDQIIGQVEPWRRSVEALRLAMRLNHTTFTIQVIGTSFKISPYHIGQLYWLLHCLNDFGDGKPVLSCKIDRLVMKCDGDMEVDLHNCMKFLLDAMYSPSFVKEDAHFPACVDAWVAFDDQDEWEGPMCFGLDFVKGLEAYPNAESFDGDRRMFAGFRLSD